MKNKNTIYLVIIVIVLAVSACGTDATTEADATPPDNTETASTPTTESTPDICAPENIKPEVDKIHKLMREFDDASLLASNLSTDQLPPVILELQRVRRDVQDLVVPECLLRLKQIELLHMTTVVNTLLGFINGTDPAALNENINLARQQHNAYTVELARVLGLQITAPVPGSTSETEPTVEAPTSQSFTAPFVTNVGPTAVNLRALPDLNGENVGTLEIGVSAALLGRTTDALWFQVEIPGQPGKTAWVFASLVQLSNPNVDLPVITP